MEKCENRVLEVQTPDICAVGYGPTGAVTASNEARDRAEKAGRELRRQLRTAVAKLKCPEGCETGRIEISQPEVDDPAVTETPRGGYDYPRAKHVRDIVIDYRACTRARVRIVVTCRKAR